jgi:hypothetical protein
MVHADSLSQDLQLLHEFEDLQLPLDLEDWQ